MTREQFTGVIYPLFAATLEDGVTYRCPAGEWRGDGGEVPTHDQIVILESERARGTRILSRIAEPPKTL